MRRTSADSLGSRGPISEGEPVGGSDADVRSGAAMGPGVLAGAAAGGGAPGPARARRRAIRRSKKVRHPLNPFRWVDPSVAWKAATGLAIYLGSIAGVRQEAGVKSAAAESTAVAAASIGVNAQERIDRLDSLLAIAREDIRILKAATGKDRLAEAREVIARPQARKPARPWWRFF